MKKRYEIKHTVEVRSASFGNLLDMGDEEGGKVKNDFEVLNLGKWGNWWSFDLADLM